MSQLTNLKSGGSGSGAIFTINSNPPDGAGNFLIAGGTDISVTNGPASNEITISFTGAGLTSSYVTDAGTASPSGGILNVLGDRDINTTGSGNTVTVHLDNAITLGDLSSIIGSSALTAVTGDVTVDAGNINFPNTLANGLEGIIKQGGASFIQTYGSDNIFMGGGCGNLTLTVIDAVQNTAVGVSCLDDLTTGAYNCAFGTAVMDHLTSGSRNSGFGVEALNQLQQFGGTANDNTGIGFHAGFNLENASGNTLIGTYAGDGLIGNGSYNTCLGYAAGHGWTGGENNNIAIINNGTSGDQNTIRIGTQGAGTLQQNKCFVAGIVGVTTSNSEMVTINSSTGQLGVATIPFTPSVVPYTGINAASSPYTVLTSNYYIGADSTAGSITVKLPNAPATGSIWIVKDKMGMASTNNITVTTVGGIVTIDGATTFVMNTNYQSAQFIFNGTSYEVF